MRFNVHKSTLSRLVRKHPRTGDVRTYLGPSSGSQQLQLAKKTIVLQQGPREIAVLQRLNCNKIYARCAELVTVTTKLMSTSMTTESSEWTGQQKSGPQSNQTRLGLHERSRKSTTDPETQSE